MSAEQPRAENRALLLWIEVVWQVTFWLGAALIVAGAFMLWARYAQGIAPGWAIAGGALFVSGIVFALADWWMQQAHWLRVRAREHGRGITIAVPIPLGATECALRWAGHFVPELQRVSLLEVISSVRECMERDEPVFIHIHDDEDGSDVDISVSRRC